MLHISLILGFRSLLRFFRRIRRDSEYFPGTFAVRRGDDWRMRLHKVLFVEEIGEASDQSRS